MIRSPAPPSGRRAVLAALCLGGWGRTLAATEPDAATLVELARSVLRVEALGPGRRLQVGSGVVVAEETLVTNWHVTRQALAVSVMQSGARLPAQLQRLQPARDLCVLRVPGLQAPAVPIADAASLAVGEPLTALGYTGGGGLHVSRGEVLALHRWDGSRVIRSSTGFSSGASGGGLFNARRELVGVLTFRLRGGEAHYFAAPADWLRGRLAPLPAGEPAPRAVRAFWERRDRTQPHFLRAAALEQSAQWPALAELAQRWEREAPQDAEAPYLFGVAQEAMDRPEQALAAWRRSLQVDAGQHRSWLRLAQAYRRLGREVEARHAAAMLRQLNPRLGRQLAETLPPVPAASSPSSGRP